VNLQLAGDVAVVVGGARGLGRAIAAAFAAEGAAVVLVDRDPEVTSVGREMQSSGGAEVAAHEADVTDFDAVQRVASATWERFGRCDHVVEAAAVGSGQFGFPFWEVEATAWERVLRINLLGAVHVAHAFAPRMAAAGRGTFLFIASVAGQIGSQTDPPYSASKAGLINFAQCAARDLAPRGVRVNSLCPGMVRTALNRSVYEAWAARQPAEGRPSYEEWSEEKIRRVVPLGRWQEPEDVAAMAVFLASPRAVNVTGQAINVDGGYVMHW
jgi:NAD(P)-dependent dehydrogenase (short-subunit alcohol dehydrogenase family)